jgi:hypothetical protein
MHNNIFFLLKAHGNPIKLLTFSKTLITNGNVLHLLRGNLNDKKKKQFHVISKMVPCQIFSVITRNLMYFPNQPQFLVKTTK